MPIPILALCEAGLPLQRTISGYDVYKNPSISSFPNGSAALYVRNGVPHIEIPVDDLCTELVDLAAARVQLREKYLSVVSVYARPRVKVAVDAIVKELCKRCPTPVIICGDWNAHHELWGDARIDERGRLLAEIFEVEELAIANDGSPTFFRYPASFSAIDVTAHSSEL